VRGALVTFLLGACSPPASPDSGGSSEEEDPDDGSQADLDLDTDTDTGGPEPLAGPLPLCVNEFMPDNLSAWQDDLLATPDWIELHNPTDAAVDLSGWTLSDDASESAKARLDGVIEAGGFLFLRADEGIHDNSLPFRLSAEGGDVALFAPDGRGQVVRYGLVGADFSVARSTDCCQGEGCLDFSYRGTPGYGNAEPGPPGVVSLPEGSYWRILAWPEVPPGDWVSTGFDDSAWTLGRAPLGYGEDDLETVLDSGPADSRVRTVWARAAFEVEDSPESAYLRLRLDDGARVFINGVEVARVNLPEGVIGPETLASSVVGGEDERVWTHIELEPMNLQPGRNVVAVDVHQATPSSEDLVLDLGLYVRN